MPFPPGKARQAHQLSSISSTRLSRPSLGSGRRGGPRRSPPWAGARATGTAAAQGPPPWNGPAPPPAMAVGLSAMRRPLAGGVPSGESGYPDMPRPRPAPAGAAPLRRGPGRKASSPGPARRRPGPDRMRQAPAACIGFPSAAGAGGGAGHATRGPGAVPPLQAKGPEGGRGPRSSPAAVPRGRVAGGGGPGRGWGGRSAACRGGAGQPAPGRARAGRRPHGPRHYWQQRSYARLARAPQSRSAPGVGTRASVAGCVRDPARLLAQLPPRGGRRAAWPHVPPGSPVITGAPNK